MNRNRRQRRDVKFGRAARQQGMSRRRFLGTAAAGVGAAVVGASGVVSAGQGPKNPFIYRESGDTVVVYPMNPENIPPANTNALESHGIPFSDVNNVQHAVRSVPPGGTVIMNATDFNGVPRAFDFGTDGSVEITQSVQIIGGEGATISGGHSSLYCDDPTADVEIRNLNFQYATWTPIWIRQSSACTIENNVINTVAPMIRYSKDRPEIPIAVAYAVLVGGNIEEGPKPSTDPQHPEIPGPELLTGTVNISNNDIDCGVYMDTGGNQVPPGQGDLTDPLTLKEYFNIPFDVEWINYRGVVIENCASEATVSENTIINNNRCCMHSRSVIGSVDVTNNVLAPGKFAAGHDPNSRHQAVAVLLSGSFLRPKELCHTKYTVSHNEIIGDEECKAPHPTQPYLEPATLGINLIDWPNVNNPPLPDDILTGPDPHEAEITDNHLTGYFRTAIQLWCKVEALGSNQNHVIAHNKIEGHGFWAVWVAGSDNNVFEENNIAGFTPEHWHPYYVTQVIFGYGALTANKNKWMVPKGHDIMDYKLLAGTENQICLWDENTHYWDCVYI